MGDKTKRESNESQAKPDPPGSLPEMVIDQGRYRADHEADTEPNQLSLHEKIDVAMTVSRERAGAEKHDDADNEHAKNSQEQKIGALAMHLVSWWRRHWRTKVPSIRAIRARQGERRCPRSMFH